MDKSVKEIANCYDWRPKAEISAVVADLYQRYVKRREESLIDAASSAAAVNAIFLSDHLDIAKITPQMHEAFMLAFPNVGLSRLTTRTPEAVQGMLAPWKGKYFEVIVRDRLNMGEQIGDIQLEVGQKAALASSATQPGWDLQIFNSDGSVAQDIQLKATNSLAYVKYALERYPNIDVVTTQEALDGFSGIESVINSGISDTELEETVRAPLEALLDSPWEELAENILPGLPFVLIAVGEGRHVLLGRKSFDMAVQNGLDRGLKTGAAMAVGGIVFFLYGGILSLPASFATRLGIDRVASMSRTTKLLQTQILELQKIRDTQSAVVVT
jgi:hypothetical protein